MKVEGHDEFPAPAEEFNSMSTELSRRLDELRRERARLREAIRRIGTPLPPASIGGRFWNSR